MTVVSLEMVAAGESVFRQRFAECCRGAAPAKAVCEAAAIAVYAAMRAASVDRSPEGQDAKRLDRNDESAVAKPDAPKVQP